MNGLQVPRLSPRKYGFHYLDEIDTEEGVSQAHGLKPRSSSCDESLFEKNMLVLELAV